MNKILLFTAAALLLVAGSCGRTGHSALDQRQGYDTLVIVSTNDIHARIDNMPKLAAYVQSQRDSFSRVLLLSAGDLFSGSPVVDQHAERGFPMIDLMNRMHYAANTVGNHAFDYGQKVLADRIAQAGFPFLCANADFSATGLSAAIKPYVVVPVDGLKVAILGLLQLDPNGLPSTLPENVDSIVFSNGLAVASGYAALRDSGHVFIVLSHLGVIDDVQLALQFPQADVIVGGHSHTTLPAGIDTNNVLITQTGAHLKHIGKTTLVLKDGEVVSKKSVLVPTASLIAVDTAMQALVDTYKNNPDMKRVVGYTTSDITGKSALGNFITDALAAENRWDMAFTNNGGIRVPAIPQGRITFEQVYELDPFANRMTAYTMSIDEIKELLKQSYNRSGKLELQISGAHYTVVRAAADTTTAAEVLLTDYAGRPLDARKHYKVGMSTYVASTYMPLITHHDEGTRLATTTAETLILHLSRHRIKPDTAVRVFVK
ncbi:MAG: bifunctional metallophosphatase/5'-nucleotidase [Prevotellaceae bacterium]|jgi:2',3'-cyclic-nucleotide 2'-phosphodiesterase (5'-nucleotidase family)|nr:bifunctional metallophosphatase/5'-nucleotidase [Prevotellaceae bacterium]